MPVLCGLLCEHIISIDLSALLRASSASDLYADAISMSCMSFAMSGATISK